MMDNLNNSAIQAYVDNDYKRCIKLAIDILSHGPLPFLVTQVFLTSLQRSGVVDNENLVERLLDSVKDHPMCVAQLRVTIGETTFAEVERLVSTDEDRLILHFCQATRLHTLGDYAGARSHFQEVIRGGLSIYSRLARIEHNATWRHDDPTVPPEVKRRLDTALKLVQSGRFHDALKIAQDALAKAREAGRRLAEASSLYLVGIANSKLGRLVEGEAAMIECLSLQQAELGEIHPTVAQTLQSLGMARSILGDDTEAETLIERAVAMGEECLGSTDWQLTKIRRDLADIKERLGKYSEAEEQDRHIIEALEQRQKQGTDEHVKALTHIGEVCRRSGQLANSIQAYREALAIHEARPGRRTSAHGCVRSTLGSVLVQAGENVEGERLTREAVIDLRQVDPGGLDLAFALIQLGQAFDTTGNSTEAEGYYEEAARCNFDDSAGALKLHSTALRELARCRERRGDHAGAATLLEEAAAVVARGGRIVDLDYADSLIQLGEACLNNGQIEQAEPRLERALEIRRNMSGVSDEDLSEAIMAVAALRRAQSRFNEALELCREAVALDERHRSVRPSAFAQSLYKLAAIHSALGEAHEAQTIYNRSLNVLRDAGLEGTMDHFYVLANFGVHLMMRGEYMEAESNLRNALRIAEQVAGHDSPEYARVFSRLGELLVLSGREDEAERHFGTKAIVFVAGLRSTTYTDQARLALARGDIEGLLEASKRAGTLDGRLNPLDRDRRHIRVFISSTFRDMQDERNVLVSRVFRRVRDLCHERGIVLTEVDLRWGITEAQAQQEGALRLCLDEVDRCDYFLALLGDRYGYVPAEISEELLAKYPWLEEYPGRSITELEIIRGVIKPQGVKKARLYLREPRGAPADQSAEDTSMLSALKGRLQEGKEPVRGPYATAEELAELVEEDLRKMLDEDFPASEAFDQYRVEAANQQRFWTREAELVAGRETEILTLNDWPGDRAQVTLLTGDPGFGKTAVLCRWAAQGDANGPWRFFHSTEVGRNSNDADFTARQLLVALKTAFNIDEPIPANSADLPPILSDWVARAASVKPLVLVFDGVDRFTTFSWLPLVQNAPVHLILSCRPGECRKRLLELATREIVLGQLTENSRREVVTAFLRRYGKTLSDSAMESIVSGQVSGNPLFLRLLLEELRVFGRHDILQSKIDECLSARTIADLYSITLGRLECECDSGRPGLVQDTFSLLACIPEGLLEDELLKLLGQDGYPLPYLFWSRLLSSAETALRTSRGRVRLANDSIRAAAERRYLNPDLLPNVVQQLIDHLSAQPDSAERFAEISELYKRLGAWTALAQALYRPEVLEYGMTHARSVYVELWADIRRASTYAFDSTFEPLTTDPDSFSIEIVSAVSLLLGDLGLIEPVVTLRKNCVERERVIGRTANLAIGLQNLAESYRKADDIERAIEASREARAIYHDAGDGKHEALVLHIEALALASAGKRDEALAILDKVEELARATGSDLPLAKCFNLRARLRFHFEPAGRAAAACDLAVAERLARACGDQFELLTAMYTQGTLRLYDRDWSGAKERFAETIVYLRRFGRNDEADRTAQMIEIAEKFAALPLAAPIIGGAESWHPFYIAFLLGEAGTAKAVLDAIDAKGNGDPRIQAAVVAHRAVMAYYRKRPWKEFLNTAAQSVGQCDELEAVELMRAIGASLSNRFAAEEVTLAFFTVIEQSARASSRLRVLAWALLDKGVLQVNMNDPTQALRTFEEQERVARDIEDWECLSHAINNQSAILENVGRHDLAKAKLCELLPVLQHLGDVDRFNETSELITLISNHYGL